MSVRIVLKIVFPLLVAFPAVSPAQSNLMIYSNSLASGWVDYSYGSTRNFANHSPVYPGNTASISVTVTDAWGAIQLYNSPFTNTGYATLSFWLNGGVSGGQQLQVYGNLGSSPTVQSARFILNTPIANTWQLYTVPLSAIGVAGQTNFSGFAIQDGVGSTEPTFYLDDIQLVNAAAPSLVHLTVNAAQPIRTADSRWYGMNAAQWDGGLDTTATITSMKNMGTRAVRLPGGSNSDIFHWFFNRDGPSGQTWASSPASFIQVITNLGADAVTTLNYGSGSSNEAAAWVAYANASLDSSVPLGVDSAGSNWFTAGYWALLRASAPLGTDDGHNFLRISRWAPLGFKYWEVGNEVYGSWEADSNAIPHDPYTYAMRAVDYISLIKTVDPTVHVGVVVNPGEDSYANNMDHPVVNPRTGQTHYGWTPVVLATMAGRGVLPDFIIEHRYPENPGGEDDAGLLQSSTAWASDAANLRQQITDYVGAPGTNIELLCTENNSVSSDPGKQSTSLVNALFRADCLGALMQTEFNGLFWWNLENGGTSTGGNNSASLYGWREYGDYGVFEGTTFFPPYYAQRLMQHFVQAGDTILTSGSDYWLLSCYAARRIDGSLAVLAINKDPTNTLTGKVAVNGYTPAAAGTVFSYGIPQDNAAKTGIGSPDVAQTSLSGAGTNFNYAFPPYSATVLMLRPSAPALRVASAPASNGQFIFEISGVPEVPYVIQSSGDMISWTTVGTNISASGAISITNIIAPAATQQFWRAMWQP